MSELANKPAFPEPFIYEPDRSGGGSYTGASEVGRGGMTMREHYAGIAMQGLVAKGHISSTSDVPYMARKTAEDAVLMADALIAELSNPTT